MDIPGRTGFDFFPFDDAAEPDEMVNDWQCLQVADTVADHGDDFPVRFMFFQLANEFRFAIAAGGGECAVEIEVMPVVVEGDIDGFHALDAELPGKRQDGWAEAAAEDEEFPIVRPHRLDQTGDFGEHGFDVLIGELFDFEPGWLQEFQAAGKDLFDPEFAFHGFGGGGSHGFAGFGGAMGAEFINTFNGAKGAVAVENEKTIGRHAVVYHMADGGAKLEEEALVVWGRLGLAGMKKWDLARPDIGGGNTFFLRPANLLSPIRGIKAERQRRGSGSSTRGSAQLDSLPGVLAGVGLGEAIGVGDGSGGADAAAGFAGSISFAADWVISRKRSPLPSMCQ